MSLKDIPTIFFCALISASVAGAQTWTVTSAPTNNYSAIAISADGSELVAVAIGSGTPFSGPQRAVYVSTNRGVDWVKEKAPAEIWGKVACSADGTRLIVAAGNAPGDISTGPLCTSADAGLTWVSNKLPTNTTWWSVACSADGSEVFATTQTGELFTTTNFGGVWVSNRAPGAFCYIATSADGSKLVAAPNGPICFSTNLGVTWVTNFDTQISARWSGVASSADVTKLAAANGSFDIYSRIYTSRDSGQTWISNNVPKLEWESIACSADGMKLITIACPNGSGPCPGPIYTSIDGGNTWTSNTIPYQEWTGVACSADGNTLAAVTGGYFGYPGRVWISQTTPAPVLNISEGNSNVMLSWTIPSTNFILQQSASMSPANWTTVSNLPVVNLTNLQDEVEIPWSAAGFYRLKTP